jgi:hypothetical protein
MPKEGSLNLASAIQTRARPGLPDFLRIFVQNFLSILKPLVFLFLCPRGHVSGITCSHGQAQPPIPTSKKQELLNNKYCRGHANNQNMTTTPCACHTPRKVQMSPQPQPIAASIDNAMKMKDVTKTQRQS